MDFRVGTGDLGPKWDFEGKWIGIGLLAKMGTDKGLLGINGRFR